MTVTSVRLNDAEELLARRYSELTGKSISALLRESLLERIEDELDYRAAERVLAESAGTTVSLADMLRDIESE